MIPMEEFNLHLTGDIHAITAAHNLCAASLDARMLHEACQSDEKLFERMCAAHDGERRFASIMLCRLQKLCITKTKTDELTPKERSKFVRLDVDPATITWNSVVDINDRALRGIVTGQGPEEAGLAAQFQAPHIQRNTTFEISVSCLCSCASNLLVRRKLFLHLHGRVFSTWTCVCFITAGPITKLCAWGGTRVEDMCYERRRPEACVD